jgi:hypothetical protein
MMPPEETSDGHGRTTEKGCLASIEINGGLAADAFLHEAARGPVSVTWPSIANARLLNDKGRSLTMP